MTSDTRTITYRTRDGERGTLTGRWIGADSDGRQIFGHGEAAKALHPDEILTDDTPGLATDAGEELTAEEAAVIVDALRSRASAFKSAERMASGSYAPLVEGYRRTAETATSLAARIERAGYVRIGGGR